jgi:hypothetical protein
MTVMMSMTWKGVSKEQYEDVRRIVNWEGDEPPGGMLHICSVDDEGLHIADLWRSAEEFNAFVNDRLMPGVQKAGITTQPDVRVLPLHAIYSPGFIQK